MDALDVVTRGYDSSGRRLRMTRQHWQWFDRVNTEAGQGRLVIVQGSFMGSGGASASANTHSRAGCSDIRTWNLSTAVRTAVQRRGRELMGAAWYRSQAQGFDPHIHNVLLGDAPAHPETIQQMQDWKHGLNGLASRGPDTGWRPKRFTDYRYIQEDDMFEPKDRDVLKEIAKDVEAMRSGSWRRDVEIKKKINQTITLIGKTADSLTVAINSVDDEGIKRDLKDRQKVILDALKDADFVDGPDNPSDDAMNELHSDS